MAVTGPVRVLSSVLACLVAVSVPVPVMADCTVTRSMEGNSGLFSKHLSSACTDRDREKEAVTSDEILAALREGRGVDLIGVVVTGDLLLDALPLVPAGQPGLTPELEDVIAHDRVSELRVISGPFSIRDSLIQGKIATRLEKGRLVVKGPVTMTGTTFERPVDFSRSVFLRPVDFSNTIFRRGCLFTQAQFFKPARFEKTAFGVRTRFHKARFRDDVIFRLAGFNGIAEFLEVTFDKEASFSQVYFKLGTGFSGSRFRGILDFSEALFEREAFFTYTIFEQDAYFRRATFRGQADFSQAEFRGVDDFSKAFFEKEPRFIRTRVSGNRPSPGGLQDPRFLYGIVAALLIFTVWFVLVLRRG